MKLGQRLLNEGDPQLLPLRLGREDRNTSGARAGVGKARRPSAHSAARPSGLIPTWEDVLELVCKGCLGDSSKMCFCRGKLPLQSLCSRHRSWHCRTEDKRGAGAALRHPELCGASTSPVAWAQLRTQPSELCPSHHCGSSACFAACPGRRRRLLRTREPRGDVEAANVGVWEVRGHLVASVSPTNPAQLAISRTARRAAG